MGMSCLRVATTFCLLLGGCGGEPSVLPADDTDASSTGGETGDTTGSAVTSGVESSGPPDPSETDPSTDPTADPPGDTDTDTDDGTDPDEQDGPVSFELLVRRDDASGWARNFRFRVLDGVGEGLILAHEGDDAGDWVAQPLPGHRVVYRAYLPDEGGGDQLRLGTLDDPLPATTTRLDVAARGEGFDEGPISVLDGEALLYAHETTLYRVDLNGLDAAPPVPLVELPASLPLDPFLVDPQGRYVATGLAPNEAGISNLARVPLLGGSTALITDLQVDGFFRTPVATPSGDGAFFVASQDGSAQSLMYVELSSDEPGPPIALVSDVVAPQEIDWGFFPEGQVRPHAEELGFVVGVGEQFERQLAYYGVEDGVALPPVQLHEPDVFGGLPYGRPWSPDGRAMVFSTWVEGSSTQMWLAEFSDGHDPVISPLGDPVEFSGDLTFQWSPLGDELYLARFSRTDLLWTAERRRLFENPPAQPQPLVGPYRYFGFQDIRDDGSMLLFSASVTEDEEGQIYGVGLRGDEPQEAVLLSGPPAAEEWSTFASFSPDGRVVAYGARTGIFGAETRLMVVAVEVPGRAVEVADRLGGRDWSFVDLR